MRPAQPADPPTDIPPEWLELRDTLPATGRLLAVGGTDSGKTTLCWWLAGELARRSGSDETVRPTKVAVVDADVGQSRIGPPACVGWQMLGAQGLRFHFVGAITPERRPSSALKATVSACEAATSADAAWTVVDTTGYVRGELAVALKSAKIKRLRPVHVLAIGNQPDLDAIVSPWQDDAEVTVHHIPTPSAAQPKPRGIRSQWRRASFAAWLSGSNLHRIEKQGREFVNEPAAELFAGSPIRAAQLGGLLLGFSDQSGRGICLGLLHSMDFRSGDMIALCPQEAQGADLVDFGCIRLEPDGTQITGVR